MGEVITSWSDVLRQSAALRQIEFDARSTAASFGDERYGTLHLMSALTRSMDVGGEVLRAYIDEPATLDGEMSYRSSAVTRSDPATVRPDEGTCEVFDLLERLLVQERRSVGEPADLLCALTIVAGPHSRHLGGSEAAIRRHLSRAASGRPLSLPGGRARAVASALGSFMTWVGLSAVFLFFGAGLVLHRALLHTLAAFQHVRIRFPSLGSSIAGPVRPTVVMRWRQFVWCAIAPRAILFATSSAITAALIIESRGVGLSPFPALTAGTLWPDSPFEDFLGAQVVVSRHPLPIWVAAGAGFFALPAAEDLERLIAWWHLRSTSRVIRVATAPVRMMNRALVRLDNVATWLNAPAMVAAGMLGVVSTLIAGALAGLTAIALFA